MPNNNRHQRKLAAILAADIVGFSRLMRSDESGTLDALKLHWSEAVEPVVADHGGRIFKTTGDGFLAEFASAVQAVEGAVAIQRVCAARSGNVAADKQLKLRIGINLGDVILDGDDVFGDGVNVAARLEGIAEPGGICVSQAVYEQTAGKVGVAFTNMGRRSLKNIGAPVQVFRVELDQAVEPSAAPPVIEDRPSIAVLPLENLSDDKSLDFLIDGLIEDIITLLARVPGFFVIGRRSTFEYKNRGADVRQIGRELGVRYIVQGSVRGSGSRLRIAVQLIEAETARQLWSHRFDAERSEALDLQDEIARAVMVELEPQLTRAELTIIKRLRPENLDAWSHFRKAMGAISLKGWNEEPMAEAIEELEQAIRLDPNFSLAYSYLALICAFGVNLSLVKNEADVRRRVREAAERAIALDPESSEVLGRAGCAIADLGEEARGCEILERAVENDPSNAQARVALGAAQTRLQQFDIGIDNMRLGMRTSPRDGSMGFWEMILAEALLRAGRLEEALAEATTSGRRDGNLYGARVVAAVALARLGRAGEARVALREARRIRPVLSLEQIAKFFGNTAAADLTPLWGGAEKAATERALR